VPGAGIWPEAVPRKNERQKKASLLNWEHRRRVCHGTEAPKAEQKTQLCDRSLQSRQWYSIRVAWNGERRMSVANALVSASQARQSR